MPRKYRRSGQHTNANKQHPLFRTWHNMHNRCRLTTHPAYQQYGGRGIEVCSRWDDFNLFLTDVGKRPSGFFIDRVDPNGNYEPKNIRWSSPEESAKNRRPYGALERFTTKELLTELARRQKKE